MKFNNILFAIAVVLIFTSCEKNDENKSYRVLRACVKTDRFSEIDSFEDLFYTEDQIAEIDGFTWNSTNWIPSGGYTYSYNNNGYLCETINDYSSTTYEYEEGNGNAKFFYFHPEDWVSGHPMIESAKHKRKPYHKRILNLR